MYIAAAYILKQPAITDMYSAYCIVYTEYTQDNFLLTLYWKTLIT